MSDTEVEGELGQISLHLAKPDLTLDNVLDWKKLARKPKLAQHSFDVGGVPCRFVYFETTTPKSNPPWLDFVNAQLDEKYLFSASSHSANGILGLTINKRLFVAAFGRSASSLILRRSIEPDFGIRCAMNLCGNEEIRQTRTQNHSLTPTHIDRQVGRPSGTFVFGLSEAEDLKFISAHLKSNPLVTLQGRDHLTIKIIGAEKLSWVALIGQCKNFLAAYDSEDYVQLFPNYRNFKPADANDVDQLDNLLLSTLRAESLDKIQLWIPEFIPDDEFSFSYSDHEKEPNRVYAYLEAGQLRTVLSLPKITLKKLQAKRIYAYSIAEDRIVSSKWWSVYDCIIFEQKLGDRHFILTDGEWKIVDGDFYHSVVDFIATQVIEETCEPLYSGICIADQVARKNREGVFNTEACVRRPQSIRFDQAKLRIGGSRKDKEFCDILDLTDDGVMRIINCKPYKGSSSISYLFAQTRFYCESFLRDQTFLSAIRDFVATSHSPTKETYLEHIHPEIRNVSGGDYHVCVWLLCDKRTMLPRRQDLPFMAQYELKLMQEHLQQTWKFRSVILRFIPVEFVNFERLTTSKKKKTSERHRR